MPRRYDDDFLSVLTTDRRSQFSHLRDRTILTYRHLGLRAVLGRALTFPLRFTPLHRRLPREQRREMRRVRRWYRAHGRPVSIAIPSYRDADELEDLVRSIRRTTNRKMVEIVVADDASGHAHLQRIRRIKGITVVAGDRNRGFAANANRAIRATNASRDAVLLNSDMKARRHWLAALQYASRMSDDVGIVGAKLVYPSGRIQFGGTIRNAHAGGCFDHRHRGKPWRWGPANVAGDSLAVCGACMYVRRELIDRVGLLDEGYPMSYEDVDWCLRAWEAGLSVMYFPLATLEHYECTTRGTEHGDRERDSQRRFWARWGNFFDARPVLTPARAMRVVYVTASVEIGDDHPDIVEHLNGLHDRGHEVALYAVGQPPGQPALRAPVRTFIHLDELVAALASDSAIKVATCANTAAAVWRASVLNGVPVYFASDRDAPWHRGNRRQRDAILASYRPEFRFVTNSRRISDRLRSLGLNAVLLKSDVDATRAPRGARGTASAHGLDEPQPIDRLEAFLQDVARPRRTLPTSDARPKLRRVAR